MCARCIQESSLGQSVGLGSVDGITWWAVSYIDGNGSSGAGRELAVLKSKMLQLQSLLGVMTYWIKVNSNYNCISFNSLCGVFSYTYKWPRESQTICAAVRTWILTCRMYLLNRSPGIGAEIKLVDTGHLLSHEVIFLQIFLPAQKLKLFNNIQHFHLQICWCLGWLI